MRVNFSDAAEDDQAGYRTCHGTKIQASAALNGPFSAPYHAQYGVLPTGIVSSRELSSTGLPSINFIVSATSKIPPFSEHICSHQGADFFRVYLSISPTTFSQALHGINSYRTNMRSIIPRFLTNYHLYTFFQHTYHIIRQTCRTL